ncbi:hypothetical protein [Alkalicoccus luteus]|uniref:Uncharacterized protein n=1 Tax=Alkalicoccus luteus TaxID=1237094 RepID=A0A969PWW7_9BACI|nr:hypothetical protein [Alkalicoccus luteus]NJP38974.1 hypothetical protein [Alkalicoccus luteus]
MRMWKPLSLLLVIVFLAACSANAGIEEETDYETFRDTINADDFTGFAYFLWNPDHHEVNIDETINSVFENENEHLLMFTMVDRSEEVESMWDNDWSNSDYHNSTNEIIFIDEGHIIDRFDVNPDELHASEHNNELASFIQQYQ